MFRHTLLRVLYALKFRGRDRLIGGIARSFISPYVELDDGLRMELDCAEWVQIEILVKGATEPLTLNLMSQLLVDGDTCIDVGAHVGHHALIAARACGKNGKVLAIDPQPYNADRIARNAQCNALTNIEVLCAAAGNEDSCIKTNLQSTTDRARLSLAAPGPNDLGVMIEVPMWRLDTLLARSKSPNVKLVKIDVEGFELEVIEGLGDRLLDCENLIFEVLDASDSEKTKLLISVLVDQGFQIRDVEGQNWRIGQPLRERNVWAHRAKL